MLVYPLPPNSDFCWSLQDVSCSIRNADINEKLRERFFALRAASKACNWPPKDDPYIDYKLGWHVPGFAATPRDSELGIWSQRFCAHRLGLFCLQSPLLNDCLAYVYNQYLQKYGSKDWIKTPGEQNYQQRRMQPQEEHLKEIRNTLDRLFPSLNEQPIDALGQSRLTLCLEHYTIEDIKRTYQFCLPWIAKWCLHSYLSFPEDWAGGSGQYDRSSIFGKSIVATASVKIDTSVALQQAQFAAKNPAGFAQVAADGQSITPAAARVPKPRPERKARPLRDDEDDPADAHWLDDPDHSLKLRHGE